jgi:hypothetical protein
MTKYFEQVATPTPDTGLRHLPGGMTKLKVYQDILADLGFDVLSAPISLSWFRSLWTAEFPDVIAVKQPRLGKCEICVDLRLSIAAAVDPALRIKLSGEKSKHIKAVRADREVFQVRRMEAMKGSEYLVLIHDGMDQIKTILPAGSVSCSGYFKLLAWMPLLCTPRDSAVSRRNEHKP